MDSTNNRKNIYMTKLLNTKLMPSTRDEFLMPFDSLFDEMLAKSFPSFSEDLGIRFFGNQSYPKVDVIDLGDKLSIEAEIPGLSKDEVSVDFEDDTLSIVGSKRSETSDKDKKYIKKELKRSGFKRSFHLDSTFDSAKIKAKFENGLLIIDIPKKKPDKTKKIKIL
jgi:HSP20 family protein